MFSQIGAPNRFFLPDGRLVQSKACDWNPVSTNVNKGLSYASLWLFSHFMDKIFGKITHFLDKIITRITHFMFFCCRDAYNISINKEHKKPPTALLCRIFFYLSDFLVPSEPFRDVLHTTVGQAFHHALVGGCTVQGTQFSHISA